MFNVTVTNGGKGFTHGPLTVTFTGGGGTGVLGTASSPTARSSA